jgi:hypothetical protein
MDQSATAESLHSGMQYPEGFPYRDREVAEARLGMQLDEVRAKIQSGKGRKELIEQLGLNGNAESVLDGIDLNVEQLEKKEGFLKRMLKLPGRALSSIGMFMKKHPVVSTLVILALAAGGVAAGFYLAGEWELLLSKVGLDKILGGAEAARELIPPIPATSPLPGGGMFEIPGGTPPVPGAGGLT